jgi:hypothetical protein
MPKNSLLLVVLRTIGTLQMHVKHELSELSARE